MEYLIVYSVVMIFIVYLYEKRRFQTDDNFLVANRQVSGLSGAMSIAASWIWAPALFISTQVGYTWGVSGLFWFTVPNMLALLLFAPLADALRQKIPEGYSYIQLLEKEDRTFRNIQLAFQLAVQIISFSIQVTAGAELIALITGSSYYLTLILMIVSPLLYSLISGLSSSVFTDAIQYLIIVGVIFLIYSFEVSSGDFPVKVFNSISIGTIFNLNLITQFGLASLMTLLFGIFADHQQWQRAFAIEKSKVFNTYIWAAILHGIVTFSLGSLGAVIALSKFIPDNLQLVGAEYIQATLPEVCLIAFMIMAICGLCSTVDSCFCAFGSLISTDLLKSDRKIFVARLCMVLLAVIGLVIGCVRPGIVNLWLLIGTIRLSSVWATVGSVLNDEFSFRKGAISIWSGIVLGGPIFAYGVFCDNNVVKTTGMGACLCASLLGYLFSKITNTSLPWRRSIEL